MLYVDFENVMTATRMNRYLIACAGNSRKAMTLYRRNLQLSQELFTVVSCFEIALRNAIDRHYTTTLGNNWLQNSIAPGGVFDSYNCRLTRTNINEAIYKIGISYSHSKLVAELGFGFWRYMFANQQFGAAGRTLLQILPLKPRSTPAIQYNHTFVFNQLAAINNIRNRIAHHEPICFMPGQPIKDTDYVRSHYNLICRLFQWMNIDEGSLLYGLDHIRLVCTEVDML